MRAPHPAFRPQPASQPAPRTPHPAPRTAPLADSDRTQTSLSEVGSDRCVGAPLYESIAMTCRWQMALAGGIRQAQHAHHGLLPRRALSQYSGGLCRRSRPGRLCHMSGSSTATEGSPSCRLQARDILGMMPHVAVQRAHAGYVVVNHATAHGHRRTSYVRRVVSAPQEARSSMQTRSLMLMSTRRDV